MVNIDKEEFIKSLGGEEKVKAMDSEAKADALEDAFAEKLNNEQEVQKMLESKDFPTVADIKSKIPTRHFRRGAGNLFVNFQQNGKVKELPPMPEKPSIYDFFELRFQRTRNHCFQSAGKAKERGAEEEVILACLLHDVVQELIKTDHGYWGAQLFEPYVPEITSFAIRYHQILRFFPDEEAGYEYPNIYHHVYGEDYTPPPHIQKAREEVMKHPWYYAPREVTVSDLYAFDPNTEMSIEPFRDIIDKHFKHPAEGLGNDNSPVAHMWRTIANPDAPL